MTISSESRAFYEAETSLIGLKEYQKENVRILHLFFGEDVIQDKNSEHYLTVTCIAYLLIQGEDPITVTEQVTAAIAKSLIAIALDNMNDKQRLMLGTTLFLGQFFDCLQYIKDNPEHMRTLYNQYLLVDRQLLRTEADR